MPHLVFLHSVWELDVKPTHVLLCCESVIVSVEKCELCVDMIGIVDWGLFCAMMGHVVIFVAPVHSTKIVILFLVLLAVVNDGEGGGSRGDVAGDGGHHGLVHLGLVIAADKEHNVFTNQLIYKIDITQASQ